MVERPFTATERMVIGNGDIGKVLKAVDRNDRLFFVSGVSNSRCEDEMEYEREIELLGLQNDKVHLVYVSTLSLFYGNSRYIDHKWQMETLVKEWFPRHTILRIGNITWGKNPNTIINFFKKRLAEGKKLKIEKGYRYLVDEEEFLHWVRLIPDWPCEMNIPGRKVTIEQIVKEIKEGKL